MGDEPSSRARHGTVPGFGPPSQPLPSFEVHSVTPEGAAPLRAGEIVPDAARALAEPTPSSRPPPADRELSSGPGPFAPEAPAEPARRGKGVPAVDIDLVYERRSAPLPDQPWIFVEIWTRNTVYQLDASLVCVEVIDQASRRTIAEHPLRGARLVGGQMRNGDAMELSHPFPHPGSEAVFEQLSGRHARFSQTSTVTRVVMRLRVLTVAPEQLLPTWEDVSGNWAARAQNGPQGG